MEGRWRARNCEGGAREAAGEGDSSHLDVPQWRGGRTNERKWTDVGDGGADREQAESAAEMMARLY